MNEAGVGGKQPEALEPGAARESAEVSPVVVEAEPSEVLASVGKEKERPREGAQRERAPADVAEAGKTGRTSAAVVAAASASNDPYLPKVERVLEDNLWEVYVSLPEAARAAFKKKGEETAAAVRLLVGRAHVRAGRIHDLVHVWLSKIPGVNEFFLMQESKIKTDQFIRLAAWIIQKGGIH